MSKRAADAERLPELTAQQQKVLDFMRQFFCMNDALPTASSIAKAFGYASANAATRHIQALARKGRIEKNEAGGWRFTRPRLAPDAHAALVRAASYLAPKSDAEASIDADEAEFIAEMLCAIALQMRLS
jgi:SOS-response transcriptional repressor LexA